MTANLLTKLLNDILKEPLIIDPWHPENEDANTWSVSVGPELQVSSRQLEDFLWAIIKDYSATVESTVVFYVWYDCSSRDLKFSVSSDLDIANAFSIHVQQVDYLRDIVALALAQNVRSAVTEDVHERQKIWCIVLNGAGQG